MMIRREALFFLSDKRMLLNLAECNLGNRMTTVIQFIFFPQRDLVYWDEFNEAKASDDR